ncbi:MULTISPECIES: efflux transporter outer membrane subunit [unclassified Pseudomonas]|uniref:efflux transporter outer membrane subunit n=1 Tax=unclassified Pseudomonas TaxID=196821 RepID=UPI00128B1DC6|nr:MULTISPECIES: efflux transporter outer membrane subunit [unclassified Pseudomonas]MPQ66332.1 efflux transporter outer membrane subunit [Pseudomonas sp. MWU12-2323]
MNRCVPSTCLMSLFLLSACSLDPPYEKPDAPIDQQWPASSAGACCTAREAFDHDWHGFIVDPRLRTLIELALENNRGLRQFAASVEEARAGYAGAESALFPSIGIDTYAGRSKLPPLVRTPGGGDSAGSIANTFQATAGFTSYELDLFGRIRSQRSAAGARFEASEADYQTARLALIGEVASTWLSLKASQNLLDLAQTTYETQNHYGQLLRKSYNLGSSAQIDVHQADAQTNTAAVQINTYRMQVAQNMNALRVLVGQPVPPALLPSGVLGESLATADVPAGLPSSLMTRRPDIMAAEALLRAANADIGAARSAYFPTFSLTSALGSLSGDFSRLLSAPAQFWSTALSGSLTLIDGGARRAQVDGAHARFDGRAAAYEATVQNAFREAADALNARQEMLTQVAAQKRLVEDYQEAYRQSRLRFEAGMDSYFSTMDAHRSLFEAQQKWSQLELAREINQVNLYKALGGGWSQSLKVAGESRVAERSRPGP